MQRFLFLAALFSMTWPALAAPEKDYSQAWALENKGKVNVRLPDGTRCDVLTPTHAVEVTFGREWQNAVGRALYQAAQMNKRAGIVLILEEKKDAVYRQRLDTTITIFNLPIDVWEVGAGKTK